MCCKFNKVIQEKPTGITELTREYMQTTCIVCTKIAKMAIIIKSFQLTDLITLH